MLNGSNENENVPEKTTETSEAKAESTIVSDDIPSHE